jgi:hypothetical protein
VELAEAIAEAAVGTADAAAAETVAVAAVTREEVETVAVAEVVVVVVEVRTRVEVVVEAFPASVVTVVTVVEVEGVAAAVDPPQTLASTRSMALSVARLFVLLLRRSSQLTGLSNKEAPR